eukprot:COSAG03_NODE_12034_length_565_cov_0.884120_1_plen_31_part_10
MHGHFAVPVRFHSLFDTDVFQQDAKLKKKKK